MFKRMIQRKTHCEGKNYVYDIFINEPCTVRMFVDTILTKYRQEWGSIDVINRGILQKDAYRYKYGTLETEINVDIMDKQIKSATGIGGWSNVNYVLLLKTPFLESDYRSRKRRRFPLMRSKD